MKAVNPTDMIVERQRGRTWTALAEELGISQQYLCDIVKGRKEPGAKACEALGIKRVVTYELVGRKR